MSNKIIISFIVPIYNTEEYLSECIESILRKNINKEIILIDDGSKDNSLKVALGYSHKYDFITVIHSQNKGQSSARNKGINIAQGEYIFFVDSDDYLLEIDLNSVYLTALENNIDIIKFQAQQTLEYLNDNKIYYLPKASPLAEHNKAALLNGYECLSLMVDVWTPAICWTMIKKSVLSNNNLFFQENLKAEDQLFYIQLLTCEPNLRVLEIGNIIYNYRLRKNSTMTNISDQFFLDHFSICKLITNWCTEHNLPQNVCERVYIIVAKIYRTATQIYSSFPENKKEKYSYLFTEEIIQFMNNYLSKTST